MPTLSTDTANAAVNAVVDRIDLGSADPQGKLVLKDSAVTIATFDFNNPAAGDSAAGVSSFLGLPKQAVTVAAGTIDNFEMQDRDDVVVLSGTVPGDITINNPTVTIGQVINLNAMSFEAV
jgi:hypothetical protein